MYILQQSTLVKLYTTVDVFLTSLPNHKIVDFSELKVLTTDGKPDAITIIETVYRRAEKTARKEENASLPPYLLPLANTASYQDFLHSADLLFHLILYRTVPPY